MSEVMFNHGLIEKAAQAMWQIGSKVPPQHARAVMLAAAASLGENTPIIGASRAELAQKAMLSADELDQALGALDFLCIIFEVDNCDYLPSGLTLNPSIAWRGDAAEQHRMSCLYPNPMLL